MLIWMLKTRILSGFLSNITSIRVAVLTVQFNQYILNFQLLFLRRFLLKKWDESYSTKPHFSHLMSMSFLTCHIFHSSAKNV